MLDIGKVHQGMEKLYPSWLGSGLSEQIDLVLSVMEAVLDKRYHRPGN